MKSGTTKSGEIAEISEENCGLENSTDEFGIGLHRTLLREFHRHHDLLARTLNGRASLWEYVRGKSLLQLVQSKII